MLHAQFAALTLVVTTVAASGCGGSSKATSATPAAATSAPATTSSAVAETTSTEAGKTLTRAELIAKAGVICAGVNAKRAAITIRSRRDFPRLKEVATYEQVAATELGKLVPPASMASDWRQIVANAQALAYDTAKYGEYAIASNAAAGSMATAGTASLQQMIIIAKRDGFKECDKAS